MQDWDMVLIFLFILMRKDMTIDDTMMDCFQVFEKFHEFLFKETHMMCVVHTASVLCCVAEGLSIADHIVLPEVLNQG